MFFYFLGLAGCHFAGTFSGVRYSRGTKTVFSLAVFSCVTCTIASLFFLALTGFHPQFNAVTTVYALFFALICLISQYTGIAIYRHADIVGSGIVRSGASLLLNCILGVMLFKENFTIISALRIACMLGASIVIFLQQQHINVRKCTWIGWLLSAVMVLNGVASSGISKMYATDVRVVDNASYCLLVNIFCFAVSATVALVIQRGDVSQCFAGVRAIRPNQYGYIILNTVSSNVTSLLSLAILSRGDIVVYTPLNSAIGFMCSQCIAVFIEKEKFMPIPTALALGATILSFWG